jgi:hypothetical protein
MKRPNEAAEEGVDGGNQAISIGEDHSEDGTDAGDGSAESSGDDWSSKKKRGPAKKSKPRNTGAQEPTRKKAKANGTPAAKVADVTPVAIEIVKLRKV